MIKTTKAQLPKKTTRVMVVIDMNFMSLKVIGRKNCLQAKSLSRLSKDLGPKMDINI